MGIEYIWLDPSAILLPGRDHGGARLLRPCECWGLAPSSSPGKITAAVAHWLNQIFFTWVKKIKSVTVQGRARSFWNTKCYCSGSCLLVVLKITAVKMDGINLILQLHRSRWQRDKTRSGRAPSYSQLWERTCHKFPLTQTRKMGWGASAIALRPNSMHIYNICRWIERNAPYLSLPSLGGFGE